MQTWPVSSCAASLLGNRSFGFAGLSSCLPRAISVWRHLLHLLRMYCKVCQTSRRNNNVPLAERAVDSCSTRGIRYFFVYDRGDLQKHLTGPCGMCVWMDEWVRMSTTIPPECATFSLTSRGPTPECPTISAFALPCLRAGCVQGGGGGGGGCKCTSV